jgi:hypothetical protein
MSKLLAERIFKGISGSSISDVVPDIIKRNIKNNLTSPKVIDTLFGKNLTDILKNNLAESLNDPNYIAKQLENSIQANKNSLLTGNAGKEFVDNILKDFGKKNPALLKMMILRHPDNFDILLKEAIDTQFDAAIKNGLLKSSDDIAKSVKNYITSPNSQNIIYDWLENLPDQSNGKTLSDMFSDIRNNADGVDDIASSMTKLQRFTSMFKSVVVKTIILGVLSFTGLGIAKIISDKVREREDFGKNITRILRDGDKRNSLIVEYQPPIDWCCNDRIKIIEIDPSIVSPSIDGMEFIPEVVPSEDPAYGKLRLYPTNQEITINETIERGSYGDMKCIYGVYKLIDCIVVQDRDQCNYNGITYYNCESTVCEILEGDSDCKLSPNRYESACTNNKKKISYEILNQVTRNGKSCLTVAQEIGNFPWTVDYVNDEVYYEETCTTNNNNCVLNTNSMNVSNCRSDNTRQITYDIDKLTVTDGKSCTQVAQELLGFNNWQEDTINRKVFRTEACTLNPVDCAIGNQNIASCRTDNTRIVSYPITTLPVSTGKVCSQVASEKSENVGQNYSWTIDTSDPQNKKVYRTEACLNPVDCAIGNQNISTCRTDNTRIVSYPITTLPVSTGKVCSQVASEKSENVGQNYNWIIDTSDPQNRKVFRTEACTLSPIDCSIGNESIGICRDDNTRIVSYPITTLPLSTGKVCAQVASEKSENVGQNYNWIIDTSDPQNKKVFRTEACVNSGVKTNVDCVLSEIQVTGVCENNKKKISYEIITPSSGAGISCQNIASIRQGDIQSNWLFETVGGKRTIYKLQDCELDAVGKGTTPEENTILDKIKSNKVLTITIVIILSIFLIYLFLL